MKTHQAPTRYSIGDKIKITPECLERMRWSARQSAHPNYPSAQFIENAAEYVGEIGTVFRTFEPGYDITAQFGVGGFFHMKDNWVEKA